VSANDAVAFEDALHAIVAACTPLASERVPLGDAAGRVLASALVASEDLVPFARSAMDGYAVRAADTLGAPHGFPIRARSYAQRSAPLRHEPGTAIAIATGAPIPLGADAVIPFEDVAIGDGRIAIAGSIAPGTHVFPPGEDARRGDVLARAGDLLESATLALLASGGHAFVDVVRRPRVTVVTSGEEIVAIDATPAFGEIRNSNATLLATALATFGARTIAAVHVGDDRERLRDTIANACAESDLVVTTGGASVGERDFVKPVLDELGLTFAFRSIAMRPARPTAFARLGDKRVVALSGNPAAASVALHELVRAAVYALGGRRDVRLPRVPARLRGDLRGKGVRTFFAFAAVSIGPDGRLEAIPLDNQCSALTRTTADASGFAVIPPGRGDVRDGETIEVDIFDWNAVRIAGRRNAGVDSLVS
jgi:molybdenum cofactor synthesis domain-containing protein